MTDRALDDQVAGCAAAHRRLLAHLDALLGDASLFTRADEVEEAWRIVDPRTTVTSELWNYGDPFETYPIDTGRMRAVVVGGQPQPYFPALW